MTKAQLACTLMRNLKSSSNRVCSLGTCNEDKAAKCGLMFLVSWCCGLEPCQINLTHVIEYIVRFVGKLFHERARCHTRQDEHRFHSCFHPADNVRIHAVADHDGCVRMHA